MTPRAPHLAAMVALALALALGGCQDPYQHDRAHQAASSRTRPTQAPRTGDIEAPGPAPAPTGGGPVAAGSRAVAAAFARGWSNWDWRTVADGQLRLARLAAGPLAGQLRSGARTTAADQSLARDRPGARGSVVAIDLKPGRGGVAGVVVTREQTYTDGHADLGGQRYRVYLTTIEHGRRGWRVTGWEPQP